MAAVAVAAVLAGGEYVGDEAVVGKDAEDAVSILGDV